MHGNELAGRERQVVLAIVSERDRNGWLVRSRHEDSYCILHPLAWNCCSN